MPYSNNEAFLDLVTQKFGALSSDEIYDEFLGKFELSQSETDFDLYLWSLAHRFKLDTEELLRQLGERWALDIAAKLDQLLPIKNAFLPALDWLISESGRLQEAPLIGMREFKVVVMSRTDTALRVCCVGPRRCCSFLEGIARGIGEMNGESLRYLRQPQSATMVELLFKTIERSNT